MHRDGWTWGRGEQDRGHPHDLGTENEKRAAVSSASSAGGVSTQQKGPQPVKTAMRAAVWEDLLRQPCPHWEGPAWSLPGPQAGATVPRQKGGRSGALPHAALAGGVLGLGEPHTQSGEDQRHPWSADTPFLLAGETAPATLQPHLQTHLWEREPRSAAARQRTEARDAVDTLPATGAPS